MWNLILATNYALLILLGYNQLHILDVYICKHKDTRKKVFNRLAILFNGKNYGQIWPMQYQLKSYCGRIDIKNLNVVVHKENE